MASSESPIRAVTFDATGTLFHSPRLGEVYSEVLRRHGVEVEPERARELIHQVWVEFDCLARFDRERFAEHPEGAKGWWKRFLYRFCRHLGEPPPGPFAAAEMYDRFARADAWEVFPEVRGVLEELRRSGIATAVLSNWDPRLPALLEEMDLTPLFDAIVYSAEVGVEKPHPEIFHAALRALELPAPEVLHVGDRRRHDLEGAQAVGMRALLLDRHGEGGDLRDLAGIPKLLSGTRALSGR